MIFDSMAGLTAACRDLGGPDAAAMQATRVRQAALTKPPGSLGLLEDIVAWLAGWQRRDRPRLGHVAAVVFAGNHGVTAQGVSPYPAAVTAQMVANFARGGAAINQICRGSGVALRVIPMKLERPTEDFTKAAAMNEPDFLGAVQAGWDAVDPSLDLLCLGEMGIGNTTAAAAMSAGLFGGTGSDWAGRGTGVDDAGMRRKAAVIDAALARHAMRDPLQVARCLGGWELAAILGAALAARHANVPVLLDGYVCTAAVAPLFGIDPNALDHCRAAHLSAEAAHGRLLNALGLTPLLDLGMRLGEASGAALAVMIVRAALACYTGMATFEEAAVMGRDG